MTINNPEKYLESLWDWGCLDQCFANTNIKVSDIDGMAERNGAFLILETKLPEAKIIPIGQDIMFNKLVQTGCFTVFIIWGHPNKPERLEIRTANRKKIHLLADLDDLVWFVGYWFDVINSRQSKLPSYIITDLLLKNDMLFKLWAKSQGFFIDEFVREAVNGLVYKDEYLVEFNKNVNLENGIKINDQLYSEVDLLCLLKYGVLIKDIDPNKIGHKLAKELNTTIGELARFLTNANV